MAFQVISDIHLESQRAYDVFEITPSAPYLALLGDIGNVEKHKDEFLAFLTRQLIQFRAVLLVPGNHEAYHSSWPKTLAILREFEEHCVAHQDPSVGQFVLLDRQAFSPQDCPSLVVLGCSLFSRVPASAEMHVSMGLNDFYVIDDWDVEKHNAAHERDLTWLNDQVAKLGQDSRVKDVFIFTHWSPSKDKRAIDPVHVCSPITTGFSTNLADEACFVSGKVKVWAFGHTHYNCDLTVERENGASPLRLFANQKGYYHAQSAGYDGVKVVEL